MLLDRRFHALFMRGGAVGLAVALGVACSEGDGDEPKCKKSTGPAYVVTVRAEAGPLPEDLVITARYGGGEESFSLEDGPLASSERIMFCEPAGPNGTGGAGGSGGQPHSAPGGSSSAPRGPVDALVCNLWSDSPVTMSMTAKGYLFEEQELELDFDDCEQVVTTDVDAVLFRPPREK